MENTLRITFRHMPRSAALESRICELLAALENQHDRITGCEVVITAPGHRHQRGTAFGVRIDLTMPGRHLHVRNGSAEPAHSDAYMAVRDAFGAIERMMRRYLHALHHHRDNDSIRTLSPPA